MPIRGILAIPGADKVLKKAANTKLLHKGVKFGGEIKGFFAEWEKLLKKGVTELRTDNEKNNPMYKINVALGFKPVPFSLDYSKKI